MALCLLVFSGGLAPPLEWGSNDLAVYRGAGEALLRGRLPYRDFFIEYPPGSLPAFVPPALLSDGAAGYVRLFASEMALVLAAALVLTALAARATRGPRGWSLPALAFAAGAVSLHPVAVTRYDAVVALSLALAAFHATRTGAQTEARSAGGLSAGLAYASLGFGAAAKLVPALAALPLAFAAGRSRGSAVRGLTVFFGIVAVFFAPALLLGGRGFLESFAYHADRGLQIESFGSSVLMAFDRVDATALAYGAFEARGPGAGLASSLSLPLTGALLLVTALAAYRAAHRWRGGGGPGGSGGFVGVYFARYAAALILAFMLGSKVLSPQYAVWLLPLVPLAARGAAGACVSALFVGACVLTTLVYPVHYFDLLDLRPPGPALLLVRNGLLALLWAALLVLPADGSGRDKSRDGAPA